MLIGDPIPDIKVHYLEVQILDMNDAHAHTQNYFDHDKLDDEMVDILYLSL